MRSLADRDAQNILISSLCQVVASLNDTKIGICEGDHYQGLLIDLNVFKTTTKQFKKVANGGYRLIANMNRCLQSGNSKVIALVEFAD